MSIRYSTGFCGLVNNARELRLGPEEPIALLGHRPSC
jgi:hypothetical protein